MRRCSVQKFSLLFIAIAASFWLVACGKPDHTLEALRTLPAPQGIARVVLLYPAPIMGSNGMVQVTFNNISKCDLASGGYEVEDMPAGSDTLAFSFCGMPGITHFHLMTEAGGKYFLRIKPYDSSFRGMLSGYPGEFPTGDDKPHQGPFAVDVLDETQAFKELKSLTLTSGR